MSDQSAQDLAVDVATANELIPIVRDAVHRYVSAKGGMGGFNTHLDYLELTLIAKMRELGWTPPPNV